MCSFIWKKFGEELVVVFNRDESVLRPKAELPTIYQDQHVSFIMPKDPQGQGSWLAVNEYGFIFALLNDYQGILKQGGDLVSRGLLVRTLANCSSWSEVNYTMEQWTLQTSQPFKLAVLTQSRQQHWHYDGKVSRLQAERLPNILFSSGHPQVDAIIRNRTTYLQQQRIDSQSDLLTIFKSHHPVEPGSQHGAIGDSYSFCMHRDDAKTQSMSSIAVRPDNVTFDYWDGSPCKIDKPVSVSLALKNR